ncbi:caspase family protein [Ensifer aridi]|uniref:caspase family protein n=1 Tax=Ensifer aridi TaxID=1708715 RepID=UPI000A1151DB|nr:caspase family protein [Ensifer aridi]
MNFLQKFLAAATFSAAAICGQVAAQDWCGSASKPDEVAICGSAELKELDQSLMGLYRSALASSSGANKKAIKSAQRMWLAERSACGGDVDCLQRQYHSQISFYGGEAQPSGTNNSDASSETAAKPAVSGEETFGTLRVNYPKTTGAVGVEALIVANDQYASLQDLQTPPSDAALITSALAFRGIKADTLQNADGAKLDEVIETFGDKPDKEIFIFYYAGHAADINGVSSLIFSGFDLDNPSAGKGYENLPHVVQKISKLGYKKILIVFDACRDLIDIPEHKEIITATAETGQTFRNLSSREIGIGNLQGIDYAISFSASKGQSAIDTLDGKNSPFAKAFAQKLREKETLFDVMIETRREVRGATEQQQHPTLELSWDEDTALNANPIQSVTFTFPWDHKGRVTKNLSDVKRKAEFGSETLDITRNVSDRSCGLYSGNATGVGFMVYSMLDCVEKYYGVQAKSFNYLPETSRDGITLSYEGLSLEVDLDGDGKTETVSLSSNRYGGLLEFSAAGHTASFYSALGPNVSWVFVDDIDGNGIRDLIFEYSSPAEEGGFSMAPQSLAVVSGERLMSGMDGDFWTTKEEAKFAPYIPETKWMGRVGGLYPVLMFHDRNIKHVSGIVGQTIKYTTYETTWEKREPNVMPNKEATFAKDGSINLESGGKQYRISSFHDADFSVLPR